ncbi:MAG TPA: carotenoid oxygenase family protein, partial [Polyangiaceae bacterium]|nr:carotenoid oxygenase family protein [Polyangiaceae bacterium]
LVAPFVGCARDESSPPVEGPDPDAGKPWWLRGNYAPVPELEAFDLEVIGALPAALDGLYLRNGPNPQSGTSDHWFLGDGMVHGMRLEAGRASFYRSRYVATELLGATGDDTLGPPQPGENPSNTALVQHGGRVLSLCEIGLPYELDSELATKGVYDFGGKLNGAMTAHPKIDPQTGELWFIGYNLLSASVDVHTVDPSGELVRTERVMLPSPVMMHDFQLTPNYVVLLDLPIVFDIDMAIDGAPFPFRWAPENGARLGLMPRNATDVRWFEIDPCYVFHTLNAYEDDDRVVLDVIRYSEMWAAGVDDFSGAGNVWRYSLDLARGASSLDQLDDRRVEMPRIDPRLQGTRHRYAYAMATGPMGNEGNGRSILYKYDLSAGTATEHRMPGGMLTDEAVFVPAAGGAEDEGFLIGYAYDGGAKKSELHVLDARDMNELARVRLPSRVPFGFHGLWLPA